MINSPIVDIAPAEDGMTAEEKSATIVAAAFQLSGAIVAASRHNVKTPLSGNSADETSP
jgi:hypothetical protein